MKYTKFTIKNYKGIPKIELDLSKKPESNIFTLVGLNESGKTTLLEAIYLFQNGIKKKDAHTLIPKNKKHNFNGEISIEAELELSAEDLKEIKIYLKEEYEFHVTDLRKKVTVTKKYKFLESVLVDEDSDDENLNNEDSDDENLDNEDSNDENLDNEDSDDENLDNEDSDDENLDDEDSDDENLDDESSDDENHTKPSESWKLHLEGKTKKAKISKKIQRWNTTAFEKTVNLIKQKLPKILYYKDFLFHFPEKIYIEKYTGEGPEQKEYRKVIQDVLYSIDKKLTTEKHLLDRMKNKNKTSYTEALEQTILKIQSKLNKEILSRWDSIFGKGKQKEVIIYDSYEEDESKKYFINLKIKQGDTNYLINDRSLGFRWFFSFLIFTRFRKVRIEDPGETLFLLDEPASNLHQRSKQKLLKSLEKVFSNCKLIYSTHSHHLINPKWLAGAYIIKNKAINYDLSKETSTTDTNISATLYKKFVSKHPEEEDHFKPILDSLDYTPSQLEMVPPIVFTEGKNDYYVFKYIMNTFYKGKYELNFYPGAGVNKYTDPFRLYLAWNKNFIALFDSDKGGKDARKQYISKISKDMKNIIFTLKDINPKWDESTTESLFSEDEKIKIIKSCFNDHKKGYDKSQFNTAIQELYIQNKTVDFTTETLEKFKQIFDFLKNKLNKIP